MSQKASTNTKPVKQRPISKAMLVGLGVVLLITAVALLWWSGKQQTEPVTAGVPGVTLSNETGTQIGQIAPDFTVPTLFDSDNQVALAYEVQALDTTLVLDDAGHVVFRDAFPTTYDQLKTVLEQLGL